MAKTFHSTDLSVPTKTKLYEFPKYYKKLARHQDLITRHEEREEEVQLHSFSTSALDVGEWSTSCSGRFLPVPTEQGIAWGTQSVWKSRECPSKPRSLYRPRHPDPFSVTLIYPVSRVVTIHTTYLNIRVTILSFYPWSVFTSFLRVSGEKNSDYFSDSTTN